MSADTHKDVWQLIEDAPDYATATADLYHWSTNYDPGTGPMTLFLDLIGYSEEQGFGSLYPYETRSLGYLELSKLAHALEEYASRPMDVMTFVEELLEAESRD